MRIDLTSAGVVAILCLIGIFLTPRLWRNTPHEVELNNEVIHDTLRYQDIEAQSIEELTGGDSLYTFRDTISGRWSAEVEGNNVAIRSLVLIDREAQHHTVEYKRAEWEVALRGGVSSHSVWGGIGVTRNIGSLSTSLDVGYDRINDGAYIGLSASYLLWSDR